MSKLKTYKLKIKVLKMARVMIKSSEHQFICCALVDVAQDNRLNLDLYDCVWEIRQYIREQLGGWGTLCGWLRDQKARGFIKTSVTDRQARLQWIDWMVTQYEDRIAKL